MCLKAKMGENYKAWDIKIDDFFKLQKVNEKLRFLLNFAVLAPSSHNSQPWKFEVKEGTIKVFPDFSRHLK